MGMLYTYCYLCESDNFSLGRGVRQIQVYFKRIMFLEEVFGSCAALFSSLIIQTPPISRENLQREYTLISVPNPEQDEVYDGLIHREYEQEAPTEVPYYEDGTFVSMQVDTRRNSFE